MELKLINGDELEAKLYPIIRKALKEILESNMRGDGNDLLSFQEAHTLLGMRPSTLYNLVSQRRIPNSKKGKRLFFSRKALLTWVESGKREVQE